MTISPGSVRPALAVTAAASLAIGLAIASPTSAVAEKAPSAQRQCRSMTTPTYRVLNPETSATLLTTWKREKQRATGEYGFSRSQGDPFQVSRKAGADLVPVHRLYNPRTKDFLWTKSAREIGRATSSFGYRDAGVDFYAATSGGSCLTPVYRYVKNDVRRYAVGAGERAALSRAGWSYESIAFFAAEKPAVVSSTKASVKKSPAKKVAPARKQPVKPSTTKAAVAKTSAQSNEPLAQSPYLYKGTHAWKAYQAEKNPKDKRLLYQIASTPTSIWLGGTSGDGGLVDKITTEAAARHQTPQFVLYAIPYRDCGQYASGGLSSVAQYKKWVDAVNKGIGNRKAVVIVEPDAIGMSCLSTARQADRNAMLRYAMKTLSSGNTWAYIHAGSNNLDPKWAAAAIKKAGVGEARGFAVNVSSFDATANEIAYGKAVNKALGTKKHFVIDTSRNGLGRHSGSNGGAPAWCNPPGRALGSRPTSTTADPIVDAYLWIKRPGESDGTCHPGDPSGWFKSYAVGLTERALDHGTVRAVSMPK
ncbi:Glycosyl hydrolases family 6 [Microlunatus soli]|uniref:Glucanase n=2 Tax=Microlunatus soli TaxID=630515 RepID=A0A1H1SR34_9ACTN|nr:Glycosyl hydrolases family 6 [Microlunatus soli]